MNKIIVGGYWNSNLGDDLFLYILSKTFSEHEFVILANKKHGEVFNGLHNVKIINESFIFKLFNRLVKLLFRNKISLRALMIKKYDFYIEIGGSIFMMPVDGEHMDHQFNDRNYLSSNINNYFILGSNFGPHYSQMQVDNYKKIFKKMNLISLRDTKSKELFKELDNVDVHADIVFSLEKPKFSDETKEYILISVINPSVKVNASAKTIQTYEKFLINAIDYYQQKNNKVVLMSFCDSEGDKDFILSLVSKLKSQKDVITYSHKNIEQSLHIISKAKKIITTRFHGMILAWLYRIPCTVISYSEKIDTVANDLFPGQKIIKLEKIDNIVVNELDTYFYVAEENLLKEIKNDSRKHFGKLKDILREYSE